MHLISSMQYVTPNQLLSNTIPEFEKRGFIILKTSWQYRTYKIFYNKILLGYFYINNRNTYVCSEKIIGPSNFRNSSTIKSIFNTLNDALEYFSSLIKFDRGLLIATGFKKNNNSPLKLLPKEVVLYMLGFVFNRSDKLSIDTIIRIFKNNGFTIQTIRELASMTIYYGRIHCGYLTIYYDGQSFYFQPSPAMLCKNEAKMYANTKNNLTYILKRRRFIGLIIAHGFHSGHIKLPKNALLMILDYMYFDVSVIEN